jgi:protein-S-isoprenylcysteine O-methyltransferase Ste14
MGAFDLEPYDNALTHHWSRFVAALMGQPGYVMMPSYPRTEREPLHQDVPPINRRSRCDMTSVGDHGQESQRMDRRQVAWYLLATPFLLALFLFLPAGTLAWVRGWGFILVSLLAGTLAALYLWRVNPEIFVARSRIHEGTKRWDRILLGFLIPAMVGIFPAAALDDGRFHWSAVPRWVCGLGYVLLLVGIGITAWAQAVNRFFEPSVRIQTERGHKVIDTGPYSIVRHPGYVAACLVFVGTALSLGSFWALIPAVLSCLLLILRTRWEDQTLQAELEGYEEYTRRVRSRLIPGVW